MCETAENITDTDHALPGEKTKTVSLTWWRRLTQVVALAIIGQRSFYGIFRCPFMVPDVSCQNCPVITGHGRLFTMFWGFWLLIPLSVVFFGRAFCGWACPGGVGQSAPGQSGAAETASSRYLAGATAAFTCRWRHHAISNAPIADGIMPVSTKTGPGLPTALSPLKRPWSTLNRP
jgi:4Fe-4S binding domain